MAYDAQKAHEYYINYKKKGLKKGRKKGSKTSTSVKKKSLVGLSTSGLNDNGKMEWALAKEKLTEQMNTELKSAGSDEERAEIRKSYQKIALQALQEIKSNPEFAAPKKEGKAKVSSGSKGSSGSKSGASSEKQTKQQKIGSVKKAVQKNKGISGQVTSHASGQKVSADTEILSKDEAAKKFAGTSGKNLEEMAKSSKAAITSSNTMKGYSEAVNKIKTLKSKVSSMSDVQKKTLAKNLESQIAELKKKYNIK